VWGKASTLFQIVVVALLMCAKAFRWTGLSSFVAAAIVASAALTAWSGIHYAWRGVAMIKKR
jgi:phosphatidylglycerophosphate synthase